VNDFNRFCRTWQVNVQADAPFRTDAETVRQLKVRNADGDMVPLGAVAEIRDTAGPVTITRYNMFPARYDHRRLAARGQHRRRPPNDGDSSAEELPRSMTTEWTELSYLQKQASKADQFRDLRQNPLSAFVLGAVLVFFVLAGLYESWSLPACGGPGGSDVGAQRPGRHHSGAHGSEYLRAGRVRGAGRL